MTVYKGFENKTNSDFFYRKCADPSTGIIKNLFQVCMASCAGPSSRIIKAYFSLVVHNLLVFHAK